MVIHYAQRLWKTVTDFRSREQDYFTARFVQNLFPILYYFKCEKSFPVRSASLECSCYTIPTALYVAQTYLIPPNLLPKSPHRNRTSPSSGLNLNFRNPFLAFRNHHDSQYEQTHPALALKAMSLLQAIISLVHICKRRLSAHHHTSIFHISSRTPSVLT